MSDSKEWKSKLLSSSFPLEYEVAKLLVSKGFAVDPDYKYSRSDNGIAKDFSVDMMATAYSPFNNPNEITSSLYLLVECKYRDESINWLFIPEPNKSDFSNIVGGATLRLVDEFSPYRITKKDSLYDFENKIICAYKGTEMRISTNTSVYDSEFKHGIFQLQYALPRLLKESLEFEIYGHIEDNSPFLFCPILLTTANLVMLDEDISIKKVKKASTLSDIGQEVPYLILFSDYGPDFEEHYQKECMSLKSLNKSKEISYLDDLYKKSGCADTDYYKPSRIAKSLSSGERSKLSEYFTHFIICNYDAFPSLIDNIKFSVQNLMQNRKKL